MRWCIDNTRNFLVPGQDVGFVITVSASCEEQENEKAFWLVCGFSAITRMRPIGWMYSGTGMRHLENVVQVSLQTISDTQRVA